MVGPCPVEVENGVNDVIGGLVRRMKGGSGGCLGEIVSSKTLVEFSLVQ